MLRGLANSGNMLTNEGERPPVGEERAMFSIKVKCFNPYTNKDVDKLFSWHKESGRLCEVTKDSAYAAGTSETLFDAGYDAVVLCEKHGLTVNGIDFWEE